MFSLIQMDTDSLYCALGEKSLFESVKTGMKKKHDLLLKGNCKKKTIKVLHDNLQEYWFPRTCCKHHIDYDKRESGLFHLEFSSGEEMCALASKTYTVQSQFCVKCSCKGINKIMVDKPMDILKKVLKSKKAACSINKGFRFWGNKILTYKEIKNGFTFFYIKRTVALDGIHTKPLDLVLTPKIRHKKGLK